ncbi:cyclase family protein [Stigmatella aurantiaca]|uniref:Cyclase n=2 Tax=Stigmatella aurantiaca (strain DW4/3-1) TaxID=378806 RepID=E3FUW4_STIAD|nr:cyclase family protein [Stigmatella aurantiaca]ADO68402.1 Putative cyclase [Stigmatella aurantiaca DW4/3-1]
MKKLMTGSLLVLSTLGCMGRATHPTGTSQEGLVVSPGARWVDLTHPFDSKTLYWPSAPAGFVLETEHHTTAESGFYFLSNSFKMPEHTGTHLDAPLHFAEGHADAAQIPLERLAAPAVVIDLPVRDSQDRDAQLQPAHLDAFEKEHGRIEPGTLVLVRTGWSQYWHDRKQYFGDDTPGDASRLHFPGISPEAARVLVERKVASVGIDTASLDHGPSKDFITHQILLKADIPGFENVAALDQLPPRGAFVLALPMKIGGGTGGPLRIIAVLPPK